MQNKREILIENIKQDDLGVMKAYLFDVTAMAAMNHPKKFKSGKYLRQMQKIYGILDALDKIE